MQVDIEQTIIRQKILSDITSMVLKPNLIEVTKLASRIISNDVENLFEYIFVDCCI
jgi:hypothetical protein